MRKLKRLLGRVMGGLLWAIVTASGCTPTVEPGPLAEPENVTSHASCLTPSHLGEIRQRLAARRGLAANPLLAGKADGVRQEREGLSVTPAGVERSEHFALKWGDGKAVSTTIASRVLEGLEHAWQEEVVTRGYPAPYGSDSFFVNAYVGNSGGGTPTIPFHGAYVTLDPEGFAYITIHPDLVMINPAYADGVTAHELFHVLQFGTGSYDREFADDHSAWYWEATAEWMAAEVYPDSWDVEHSIGAYAIQPFRSIAFFSGFAGGELDDGAQYGATIFPRYLSEHAADVKLVQDSWVRPSADKDVLGTISDLLAERGLNLADEFVRFAGHNTVWDYDRGSKYASNTDRFGKQYRKYDKRVIAEIPDIGTSDWIDAPVDTLPWGYGYNVLRVEAARQGRYTFSFEGQAQGDSGASAAYRGMLVRDSRLSKVPEYIPVTLASDQLAGEVSVEIANAGEELFFVVAATPTGEWYLGETFGFRYKATWEAPAPPALPEAPATVSDPAAGGCAVSPVGGTPAPWTGLVLVVLLALSIRGLRTRRSS